MCVCVCVFCRCVHGIIGTLVHSVHVHGVLIVYVYTVSVICVKLRVSVTAFLELGLRYGLWLGILERGKGLWNECST